MLRSNNDSTEVLGLQLTTELDPVHHVVKNYPEFIVY